jgi:DNA-binding response OmpR family regulator
MPPDVGMDNPIILVLGADTCRPPLVCNALASAGYDVINCDDGRDALTLACTAPPRHSLLLILSAFPLHVNVLDLLATVRKYNFALPIIVSSTDRYYAPAIWGAGASAFVVWLGSETVGEIIEVVRRLRPIHV